MHPTIKELALAGDWQAAQSAVLAELKQRFVPAQIAEWLADAGLAGSRDVAAQIQYVLGCLNIHRREFFKTTEWWVIQKASGFKDMFELECLYYGYSLPPELAAENQAAYLLQRKRALAAELAEIDMRLEGASPVMPRRGLRLLSVADEKLVETGGR